LIFYPNSILRKHKMSQTNSKNMSHCDGYCSDDYQNDTPIEVCPEDDWEETWGKGEDDEFVPLTLEGQKALPVLHILNPSIKKEVIQKKEEIKISEEEIPIVLSWIGKPVDVLTKSNTSFKDYPSLAPVPSHKKPTRFPKHIKKNCATVVPSFISKREVEREEGLRAQAFEVLSDKENLETKLFKTKMCLSVEKGIECPHGNKCRFAHILDELTPNNCLFKNQCRLVYTNTKGFLVNVKGGKKCEYIHPEETKENFSSRVGIKNSIPIPKMSEGFKAKMALNPVVVEKEVPRSNHRTRVCVSVTSKKPCPHGDKCNFAHNSKELNPGKCSFGQNCRNSEKCKFIHEGESTQEYSERLGVFPALRIPIPIPQTPIITPTQVVDTPNAPIKAEKKFTFSQGAKRSLDFSSPPTSPTPQIPTPQIPTPQIPTPQIPTPQIPTPHIPTPQIPTNYRSRICTSVMANKPCKYGEKCMFAHNAREIRPSPCTFGQKCRNLQLCKFIHEGENPPMYCQRLGLFQYKPHPVRAPVIRPPTPTQFHAQSHNYYGIFFDTG
jgi:hypothetical protein